MDTKPVAVVTGASRGIGRAIAVQLARMGYFAVINFCTDEKSAAAARQEIVSQGGSCECVQADIGQADGRQHLLEHIQNSRGRLDLLVNNAGIAPLRRQDLLDVSEESYDRVMSINLKGPFFLTQQAALWMMEQKKMHPQRIFRIINISSISAYTSSTTRGEYCISKAGLSMMTRLFADRLAEFDIGVYEIRPGIIQTDMTAAVKEKYDRLIAEGLTPQKRWGRPEDVAQAVAAVAEGRLDFSTGQVINVDGGFHLRRL
ncbi:MAG TPA: 3-ketoacyl-ACP reductase [Anaerohalosphaeraceae bacterium]|nr:3-ketoacyl-ACP reductase [Phycisphaerae bacterium]HOK94672.1 3-ketoacyl-ACP reductase [Anaerohalosphaeraceae bacterium]HOL32226.1 3-ketoacyl-ACP reductase [Anaerohalosphaeraceae bacterium]HOM76614.1 3-ketoacyl-ACP reductase [Anaerohalosphaeraceae bacterium]HPC63580.1 3-ketoacyl-ACP reductase [Anaerohalosphaeraceae bacterium]